LSKFIVRFINQALLLHFIYIYTIALLNIHLLTNHTSSGALNYTLSRIRPVLILGRVLVSSFHSFLLWRRNDERYEFHSKQNIQKTDQPIGVQQTALTVHLVLDWLSVVAVLVLANQIVVNYVVGRGSHRITSRQPPGDADLQIRGRRVMSE